MNRATDIPSPATDTAPTAGTLRRSGMALVEVSIALAIAMASIVGLLALANQAIRLAHDLHSDVAAACIAESEMEQLRALSWQQLTAREATRTVTATPGTEWAPLPDGQLSVSIAPPGQLAHAESLRLVTVRVTWTGRNGRPREIFLSSLMTARRADS